MIRLASICVAILIAFPTSSFGQEPRRKASAVRPASSTSKVVQGTGVPRPTRPVGRLASARQNPASLLQEAETVAPQPSVTAPSVRSEMILEDEGMIIEDEGAMYVEDGGCSSCGDSGCTSCGADPYAAIGPYGIDICNPTGLGGRRLCICLPNHGWASVDYLGWYQAGMQTPALVTTSPAGTSQAAAGVLPNAQVLYGGNDDILSDTMNGVRVRVGVWSPTRANAGAEGEYFGFSQQTESFDRNSTGSPILARPFYNNITGLQDSELVAFPNVLSGRILVNADSQLASAAVRFRRMLCCTNGCGISAMACSPVQSQSRIDATVGWRYMQLREGLMITEDLISLDTNNPGSFLIQDSFKTFNQFNGAELGFQWLGRRGYWSAETILRVSIGNSMQRLDVAGTTQSPKGNTAVQGGLLAQPGRNIGTYEQEEFAMIPELGGTIGYQLTERLKLNVGYTFLYWSNLIRPGDQIDTTVNTNLMPPVIAGNTFLGPAFEIRETDYWVQGLSVGGEYRW
ncbi:MAG: BBP7 family outer membrane beta-barrel protein [Planctomycetes bacterium]|nr:BBP7 family outer membrane beta-barrel protein [Planctomycetota bacterium]